MTAPQSILPEVVYKPIEGFPAYRVGDDASVWSRWMVFERPKTGQVFVKTSTFCETWTLRTPSPDKAGYIKYNLTAYVDGRRICRARYAHRLVLEAFVGPCPPGMEACHWDGDRTNNRLSNLRWDTPANNTADKVRHGTTRMPHRRLTAEECQMIADLREKGHGLGFISRATSISHERLRRYIRRFLEVK